MSKKNDMINVDTRCFTLRLDAVRRRKQPVFNRSCYEFQMQSKVADKLLIALPENI